MTDPLALEPVLAPSERETTYVPPSGDRRHERYDAFVAHVQAGGKVEARDWMPDEYRMAACCVSWRCTPTRS